MKPELFSAIIAASAALLGVVISQIFSLLHKASERKHEQRVFLREKFEEMTFLFQNSLGWLKQLSKCQTLTEALVVAVSQDAQAALVLSKLYFPEIEGVLERYVLAQKTYFDSAIEIFQGVDQPISLAPFVASSHALNLELFSAKDAVMDCIKDQVSRYAGAR